ncbi:alpha-glucosidase/alpha-galactosidase [Deinococcus gobiensis]|uniref:Glycoside hydrolase family 4 n=1 Tax=Deinococcus gobiensis (strain DSM 21396 / JCM 16679 / CGMCC 1.7299 / I-0) TaxID=745776 RepID=H8GSY3_DEIGI|nr:alpha-glucosidase/alpha-galactosidase [Deinococcus gobiensis]AFD25267.1 Glycoside hydrolase family 4 [Deinococcus gobiensis I-0]
MTTPKIAFVGAGSTVFAKNLLGDILSFPELGGADIRLFDINQERLDVTEQVAHRVARTVGASPRVIATTDRDRALDGADFVINMIQVGGYQPATVTDFEVPKAYGLRQTIADTLGIGGIMRALRTVPVLADMSRDMERLCPDTLHLNYVNPMAMNIWGLARLTPRVKTVGLCHSVQHTAEELAKDLGIPVEEIDYLCAGINHMAFYLKFEHRGQSLYPRLMELAESGQVPEWNRVRYEMLRRLGSFVTESSEHFSEYVPYFIKRGRDDLLEKFNVPLDEYPRRCVSQIGGWEDLRTKLQNPDEPLEVTRSVEYGSLIIHSMVTGQPRVVYGNVMNSPLDGSAGKLIANLPDECSVEVPCLVDRQGIQPTRIGRIPPQLAGLMQTNINVQALTVEAIVTGNREHIFHAAMLDPHTSAELDLDQIWALTNDLLNQHGDFIPETLQAAD